MHPRNKLFVPILEGGEGVEELHSGRAQDGFGEVDAEEARCVGWERPEHGRAYPPVEGPSPFLLQKGPTRPGRAGGRKGW